VFYKESGGEFYMLMRDMCPYHAPCGLCTKYDKPCQEVCNKDRKPKSTMPNDKDFFNGIETKPRAGNLLKLHFEGEINKE